MNKKKIYALGIILSVVSLNTTVFAGANYSYSQQSAAPVQAANNNYNAPVNYNNGPLQGSVISVPAGSSFSTTLTSALSSSEASVGQPIYAVLGKDFFYNGKLIAPQGSSVTGTVIEASSAKRGNINGKLSVRFTQINTPMGTQIPISAIIKTNDNSGLLVGGTKADVAKEYTKDVAAGSAVGALSGLVFGALASGDRLGRGVALGTAVGAGGGLIKSAIDKGNDVYVPANSNVELYLTQPITVSSSNYSFEN